MSEIIAVSDESLDPLLAKGTLVLLDLWAPWCQPCRVLSPLLETLAQQVGETLTVAKLNVEKYPDIQQRFAVRGIPTLLLFKQGKEISRQVGVKSLPQLRSWLEAEGATFTDAVAPSATTLTRWPTFYNDPSLHQFLAQRLQEHAAKNEIKAGFMPFWSDNQGTLSAAMAHHEDLEVFSRLSGLPAAIGALLETVAVSTQQDIEALFSALTPGKEVGLVPLRWISRLLSDTHFPWRPSLQNPALDALRTQWLALAARQLNGDVVEITAWSPMLNAENVVEKGQELESNLASLLSELSPPPDAEDARAWTAIKIQARFILTQFLQIKEGWTPEDRAAPARRFAWFKEKEAQEPGQRFSDERLIEMRELWLSENQLFAQKEETFFASYAVLLDEFSRPQVDDLLQLLRDAPRFVSTEG